jgi:type I restriction enzyme M protein
MSTKPEELNKIIADLRQIIVGKVAMPTDQIEQITLFLFLKQISVKHDDLVRLGSKKGLIFVDEWAEHHFEKIANLSGEELVSVCRSAIESLYKNPNIDSVVRRVFTGSFLKILEPKVLSKFISYLDQNFSSTLDLGDFYESLLPILGTQNELGQFRTPRHIINFIVQVVNPEIGQTIVDPACGSAGFLVCSFDFLKSKYSDAKGNLELNPDQVKSLYNDSIFGWDMEPLMVKFSLANLYLHGLKVPNVSESDTLTSEPLWDKSFDIIVANPPFITPKGGAQRHSKYAVKSNKTEVLFLEYIIKHLNFDGRMGVIVPEAIAFSESLGHKAIRKLLIDNGLWVVASLPRGTFNPYSNVKTLILFLDKKIKPKGVFFTEIQNHGFSLGANPDPIRENDLPKASEDLELIRNNYAKNLKMDFSEFDGSYISNEKILEEPLYSLHIDDYKKKKKIKSHLPLKKLGEIATIKTGKIDVNKAVPNGKYPFFTCAREIYAIDDAPFEGKAILVAGNGDLNVKYYEGKFNAYQRTYFIFSKNENEILPKYIYWFMVNYIASLKSSSRGSTIKYIKLGHLSDALIPVMPSLQDQIDFVTEIESSNAEITKAQEVITREEEVISNKIRRLFE